MSAKIVQRPPPGNYPPNLPQVPQIPPNMQQVPMMYPANMMPPNAKIMSPRHQNGGVYTKRCKNDAV